MPDIGNTIQNTVIDTTMGVAVGETAGDIATDILLDELIDALVEQYAKASLQMQEKCDKYFGKYVEEDKKKRALLDAGKISKDDYRAWQNSKALGSKQWMDMRDTLAQDLTNCNEIAADIINDRKCDIYALNHNYGMYEIENNVGAYTSYTLYDHNTVERLIAQNPEILPKAKINIPKDLRWNKHLLTSAVTQGILQGESIPAIAKRMASVTDMDKDAAIRNARTATTGAQNAGRVDSYKHAEKLGIKVTQIWISTLDGRTRTSHRHLMGQKRPLGKPFSNGLLFPGDPNGPGWEVYNCRCTLIAEPDGSGYDLEKTIDKNLSKKGMTFDEWLNEQPLSKHYGESKQHYLERYAKHKQQLPFSDWLEETAAPDSVIQSVWGDKKMSQMYNEIKAQNVTDANKFYKELSKLGKPSEIWDKYLTGQLDAEDMKNFEDILKKYLPSSTSDTITSTVNAATSAGTSLDKITSFDDFGKKGVYEVYRVGDIDFGKKEYRISFAQSKEYADSYSITATHKGMSTKKYNVEVNNPLVIDCKATKYNDGFYHDEQAGTVNAFNKLFGTNYDYNKASDMDAFYDYTKSGSKAKLKKLREIDQQIMDEAVKQGYDAVIYKFDKLEDINPNLGVKYINGKTFNRNELLIPSQFKHNIHLADDVTKGKAIHPKAQESLDKIKWEKGPEMSFEDADTFHVNPKYDGINKIYSVNCQTCTFAYEARRQGYNIEALGKDINHHNTYKIQQKLGEDQANGWINTVTGKAPENLIDPTIEGTNNLFKQLDAAVGKNGERYTMGVRWKTGGAHAINVDRDAAGNIRIIDNQRGKNEKHIWTGEKEIKSYFGSVSYLRNVYRVDDCVPNFEYLNMIVKKSNTVQTAKTTGEAVVKTITKQDLPANFDDLLMGTHQFKNKSDKVSDYLTKKFDYEEDDIYEYYENYVKGKVKDSKLDEIFGITDTTKAAAADVLDKSQFAKKKMSQVYTDIKMTDSKTANAFYKELQGMGKPSDVWDKYLKGELDPADVQKIEKHLAKKYSGLEEALPGESVTGLDIDTLSKKKVTGVYNDFVADGDKTTANQYYNTLKKIANDKGYKSQGDVWKKYLAGELDFDDIEKIDKFVIKKYSVTTTAGPNLALNIKIDDATKNDLTKFLKAVEKQDPSLVIADKIWNKIDNEMAVKYKTDADTIWEKYLKGEIKDSDLDGMLKPFGITPASTKVDDIAEIKKTLPTVLVKLSHEDLDLYNKVQSIISSAVPPNMIKAEYWQKYLKGEIINTDLDDVVKQYTKADLPDILKKTDLIDPMTGEVLDKIEEFEKIKKMPITDLDDMANKLTKDYYGLKVDDAKEILKGSGLNIPEKTATANATNNIAEIAKNELDGNTNWFMIYAEIMDIDLDLAHELKDIATKIKNDEGFGKKYDVLNAYFNGTLKSTELDDIFTKIYKDKIPTTSATTKTTTAVDIDAIKNKKVTAIYNEIKADLGTSEANAFYNKTLKEIGSKNSWSQGEVWKKYLAGDLDADDAKKIDDHLIKKYSKTVEPPKPTFDKSAFDTKKMSQVYNDIKATDTATANKFYNDLKKMGKPSEVWDEYLKGNLPQDKVDIIETHLKKKYATTPSVQTAKTTNTTQAAKKSDELIKAEEKLKTAQDELKATEKALKDNVDTFETWDGIWKEEVTLADYAKKKSTISAKKLYYEEEIDKLEHDPNYKSWLSEEDKQDKIWNLQHLYSDLEDFEEAGKKAEKYFNDLEKAQNKVTAAQKEVDSLQPAGEAYTQARKDNAKWFTSKSYHTGDKYYSNLSATKNAHKSATSGEHNAYYEYTSASGGFNRPLAGFKAPKYSGGSGWDEKYYKGVGKVPLDNEGKGKDIKNLTSLIEKSKMEDDIWIQTAQNYATLEGKNGFLGIPYGTLSGMTDKELQQFVGVENQLGQFISGSINRGGGSYTPGNMRINIYCPKGSEALYVLSDGAFGKAEHEIILQRGGTYKVSKIYWGKDVEHGGKKLIVDLELRLEKGYNKYEK